VANTVRNPYSNTAGNTPSSLGNGVIAVNQADGKLFYRSSAGVVTALATGGGSTEIYEYATTANFPATGSAAQLVIATDTGRVYRWMSTFYVEVGSVGGGVIDSRWDLFLPPAPTSVTAVGGNAQATVSWTAPTGVLSQAPLTNYILQYQPSGGSWTPVTRSASTATSAVVTSLTNSVAHQFRVAAVNGVGTGSYSTASSAVTPTAGDSYWSNVQLLLPGDTSTADASSYARSVTATGAASSATQSKWGGSSISFNGSGQYLTVADSAALELGGSDFAIELWMRTTQTTTYATLASRVSAGFGSGSWSLMLNASGTGSVALYAANFSTSAPMLLTSGVSVADGAWHHVAWVRNGTQHSLYVDGTRYATATSSMTVADISQSLAIGTDLVFSGRDFSGYIDDFRYTVGTNRNYTGATITVPSAAFPDS
jgi:hypothetical protein